MDPPAPTAPSPYLSAAEAAAYVKFSERKIRELTALGAIPHIRIDRLVRFAVPDLDAWMRERTVQPRTREPLPLERPLRRRRTAARPTTEGATPRPLPRPGVQR